MDSEIYWRMFEAEESQRRHQISLVNLPVSGAIALGTGIVSLAVIFPYNNCYTTTFFGIFTTLSFLGLCYSSILIFLSLFGARYKQLAELREWRDYYDSLVDWYGEEKENSIGARKTLEDVMRDQISELTEYNRKVNVARSSLTHRATIYIFVSFLFLFFFWSDIYFKCICRLGDGIRCG